MENLWIWRKVNSRTMFLCFPNYCQICYHYPTFILLEVDMAIFINLNIKLC